MKRTSIAVCLALTTVAATGAPAFAGAAAPVPGRTAAAAIRSATDPLPPLDAAAMRAAISGLPDANVTGALVEVTGSAGRWRGTAGVGDIRTGRPVPANGHFRVGSISKWPSRPAHSSATTGRTTS
ncbi:hypothetical protein ACQP25_02830 [Microtetraspora malaysiensis]|uniref:hypothetical protein n=1 Tax=Microtetraspora malaysiensis TaxID=161358 RepID=UPI003D8DC706